MKYWIAIHAMIGALTTAQAATIIGSDDFNDNSMDVAKWTHFVNEAGTALTETNGRLEFTATGMDSDHSQAWMWIANGLSYTNDWVITLDTVNQLDENSIADGDEIWLGFGIYSGSVSNSFGIDRNKGNNGVGYHDIVTEGSTAGISQFKNYQTASSDSISFSIAFDAVSKTLSCSYDQGGGVVLYSNMDVSAWGMTSDDVFTPFIYGGSRGVVVSSGDTYVDNFQVFDEGLSLFNFSGGDDFNDNVVDSGKWSLESSGNSTLTEINGRLEFSGNTDEAGATWLLNTGSYTQDWAVVVDAHNSEDNRIAGMYVSFGPSNSWVNVENQRSADITDQHVVLNGFSVSDDDMADTYVSSAPIANDTVRLALAFDAATKTIYGAYNDGAEFRVVTNFNISSVGMAPGDPFTLGFYAGTEDTSDVTPGTLYFDNFSASSDRGFLDDTLKVYSSSIVGSWIAGDPTKKDSVMVSFLTNGTFFLSHDGITDEGGQPGMERGTYTWNSTTGEFVANVTVDTCGDWGLSHPGGSVTVEVDGDNLIYTPAAEGPFELKRVNHPTIPPSLVGGWYNIDTSSNNHENVALTFLPNGIYFFAQDGNPAYDPNGEDGMERGIYSYNAASGTYTASALTDTCGEWGPNGTNVPFVVDGNTMQLTGANFVFKRVVDPDVSDVEGDGLPDVWEQLYFGNPTNATASGNNDGDTLDNRSEYIAGTDPTDGGSFFAITNSAPEPSGYVLNWPAVEGRVYSVLWTDSLSNPLQTLASGIAYPQNSYTDTVHSAESGGFYNLKVEIGN